MITAKQISPLKRFKPFIMVFVAIVSISTASAQNASERTQLDSMLRQLDLMQMQLSEAPHYTDTRSRYYFDYQRLNADLARVRSGIQEYLAPPRAQPRDPMELSGHYQQERNGGNQ